MGERRGILSGWWFAVLAGVALSVYLLVPPSASALTYASKGAFGGLTPPSFSKPIALTVDPASGDLLVVDVQAKTISRFSPNGSPDDFTALSSNVIDGASGADQTPQGELNFGGGNPREEQIAVAPTGSEGSTAGNIYVVQPGGSPLIDVFGADGSYRGQITASSEGPFGSVAGVSVAPSGTVFVSDTANGKIHKFKPTSNSPFAATNPANFSRAAAGVLAAGAGSTSGFLFANKFGGEPLKIILSEGIEEGDTQYPVTTEESLALAVNPENGHLFTAKESGIKEYDPSGPIAAPLISEISPTGGEIQGVAVDGTRELVYLSRSTSHTIEVWEAVRVPEVEPLPAGPVGQKTATLRGEVNPNGLPLSECFFEWGETTAYDRLAPCEAPDAGEVGSGDTLVPVHADVAVESGTTYHFRLVVTNANTGPNPIQGPDGHFAASGPQVRGERSAEVAATTARVAANIDPNGEETGFVVEYLDEAAYQGNPPAERFAGALLAPAGGEREVPAAVAGTGNIKAGSAKITGAVASAGAFGAGQTIENPVIPPGTSGIPTGTTIESLQSPTELKLTKLATMSATHAVLTATGPQPVSQLLTGLSPNTTYHFRFRAENGGGVAIGLGTVLVTAALPEEIQGSEAGCAEASKRHGFSAALPDCRVYEMVSPSHKIGEVIPPEPSAELGGSCENCLPGYEDRSRPMQSTPDGSSVLYSGQPFFAGLSGGQNAYLSSRGESGWGLSALNPLATNGTWEAFSPDLSRGVLGQVEPALAATAPVRGGEAFSNLYLGVGGSLTPLITEEPPHREPGRATSSEQNRLRVRFVAANSGTGADGAFTRIFFEANDALTTATTDAPAAPDVPGAEECTTSPCDLYQWSGGQLSLVNVAPGNAAALGKAAFGGGRLLEREVGLEAAAVDNAVSADGKRVFWGSEETGHVYARLDGEKTLEVPGPASCTKSVALASRACFLNASADGSEVLLSDGEIFALNGSETAYERIEDLSEGEGGFEGLLALGEEGGRIVRAYFVDAKALPGATANVAGEEAGEEAGDVNLYYWHGGTNRFIASLPVNDDKYGFSYGSWKAPRADRTAQATADGSYLTFMSRAPLTGYDNDACRQRNLSTHEFETVECTEVFEYAAESGALVCPSCNSSGELPVGKSNLTRLNVTAVRPPDFIQPNNLPPAGNGRLFFESQDALVPQDTNGDIQDVYEWEPSGVGTCVKSPGCVRLISSGSSDTDSMFMDASRSGDDAFFITRQQLVASDEDQQLDLYDARVGGGFAEEASGVCSAEACRGPQSEAPAQPPAASQSFTGPGNPGPTTKQRGKQKNGKKTQQKSKKTQRKKKHKKRAAERDRGGI